MASSSRKTPALFKTVAPRSAFEKALQEKAPTLYSKALEKNRALFTTPFKTHTSILEEIDGKEEGESKREGLRQKYRSCKANVMCNSTSSITKEKTPEEKAAEKIAAEEFTRCLGQVRTTLAEFSKIASESAKQVTFITANLTREFEAQKKQQAKAPLSSSATSATGLLSGYQEQKANTWPITSEEINLLRELESALTRRANPHDQSGNHFKQEVWIIFTLQLLEESKRSDIKALVWTVKKMHHTSLEAALTKLQAYPGNLKKLPAADSDAKTSNSTDSEIASGSVTTSDSSSPVVPTPDSESLDIMQKLEAMFKQADWLVNDQLTPSRRLAP